MRRWCVLFCWLLSASVWAQDGVLQDVLGEQAEGVQYVNMEQLQAEPLLLQSLLDAAVEQEQYDTVRVLLPIFEQLEWRNKDGVLLRYARAVLAEVDGDVARAVSEYRSILAERTDLTAVRLRLALLLLGDKQFEAAQHQFEKVRSDRDLPEHVGAYVSSAQDWAARQQQWSFYARARYLSDNNINQAPKNSGTNWQLPEAKAAQGFSYYLGAGKTKPLWGHWALQYDAVLDGKVYFGQRAYHDHTANAQVGLRHRTLNSDWQFAPFYEYRHFGGKTFSHQVGLKAEYNRILSQQWRGGVRGQYGYKSHAERRHLDGSNVSFGGSLRYAPSPTQAWQMGVDAHFEQARDTAERYRRVGMWMGWEQEWQAGWSSAFYVGVSKRVYPFPDVAQIRRRDTEYFAQASVWHRAVHWRGLTPRLVWQGQYSKSNHFWYGYHKQGVFLDVSKTF